MNLVVWSVKGHQRVVTLIARCLCDLLLVAVSWFSSLEVLQHTYMHCRHWVETEQCWPEDIHNRHLEKIRSYSSLR